jgi:hypothetical protein
MSLLFSWFPMILLIGVWIFFLRKMQVGGGSPFSFGKIQARLRADSSVKVNQCLRDVLDQILHGFSSFAFFSKQQHSRISMRMPLFKLT